MATSNPTVVTPVLFYDFNDPAENDGTYVCLAHQFLPVAVGDEVLFGVPGDECVASGRVLGFEAAGRLVRCELLDWPELSAAVPESSEQGHEADRREWRENRAG